MEDESVVDTRLMFQKRRWKQPSLGRLRKWDQGRSLRTVWISSLVLMRGMNSQQEV